MSFLGTQSHGSLLSDESLLHAREGYRPTRVIPSAQMAFAQWTERLATQSELVSARELAGLSEPNLAALADEFEESPWPKRRDRYRFGLPVALGLAALGATLLLVDAAAGNAGLGINASAFRVILGTVFGLASAAGGAAVYGGFAHVTVSVAYGKVGLYVGKLNEQHPWLYKAFLLSKNDAANAYRLRILAERGPLRGVDYLMMREIAQAQEGVELTQAARHVADYLQGEGRASTVAPALPAVAALSDAP